MLHTERQGDVRGRADAEGHLTLLLFYIIHDEIFERVVSLLIDLIELHVGLHIGECIFVVVLECLTPGLEVLEFRFDNPLVPLRGFLCLLIELLSQRSADSTKGIGVFDAREVSFQINMIP